VKRKSRPIKNEMAVHHRLACYARHELRV
jgi:hypothetical protein